MSQHRGRNIYTLGDFRLSQQRYSSEIRKRPTTDVFERDPFKIQSYSFRYAERPTYPMRLNPREPEQAPNKQFNVFYSNHQGFSSAGQGLGRTDSRRGHISKFQEFRKKKSLIDGDSMMSQQRSSVRYPSSHNTLHSYQIDPHSVSCSRTYQSESNAGSLFNSYYSQQTFGNTENTSQTSKYQKLHFPWERQSKPHFYSSNTGQNSSSLLRRTQTQNVLGSGMLKRRYDESICDNSNTSSAKMSTSYTTRSNCTSAYNGSSEFKSSQSSMKPNISQISSIAASQDHHKESYSSQHWPRSKTMTTICPSTSRTLQPHMPPPMCPPHKTHPPSISTPNTLCFKRKLSTSPGCEISINIKDLKENETSKNLTIKIARDDLENNLDVTPAKKLNLGSNNGNIRLNISAPSAASFVADKRQSKFAVNQPDREREAINAKRKSTISLRSSNVSKSLEDSSSAPNPFQLSFRERTKTINDIYAPQLKNTATQYSSMSRFVEPVDRMPSMIPWLDNSNLLSHKSTMDNISDSKSTIDSNTDLRRSTKSTKIADTSRSSSSKLNRF